MDNADRLETYFHNVRGDALRYLPRTTRRLLSIGCAAGATEAHLKEQLGLEEVVGVEYEAGIAAQAEAHLDAVHVGDIERMELPYTPGHFDAVLCLDVLEHLRDPWGVLGDRLLPLLAPGGVIIVSLPNVRYWMVLWRLLWGRWAYARRGVLDVGHLRFFTPQTARQMLLDAGFEAVTVRRKYRLYDGLGDRPAPRLAAAVTRRLTDLMARLRLFDLLYPFRDFFTFQIVLVARKPAYQSTQAVSPPQRRTDVLRGYPGGIHASFD